MNKPFTSLVHNISFWLLNAQVGVGLMVFQQSGGINGIAFYASEIFVSAGMDCSKFSLLFCTSKF